MSDETTLLPCPFCGGEADEYEGDYGNGIYCMRCGAMVGEPIHLEYMTTKRVSIAEAIAAWNSRADYHGYEQAAIEAWESIKAWNARAERTCEPTEEGCCPICGEDLVRCDVGIGAGGGAVELDPPMYYNYCPQCGARVKAAKQ